MNDIFLPNPGFVQKFFELITVDAGHVIPRRTSIANPG